MRNSHGHETGYPSLLVSILMLHESDSVVGNLDCSQLDFSHGYERIRKEVVEQLAQHIEFS